jgi:hypothetical protein
LDALLDISGLSSAQITETHHSNAGGIGTSHMNMLTGNGLSISNLPTGNRRSPRQVFALHSFNLMPVLFGTKDLH